MIYDKRNRDKLAKLADNTRVAAMKWYNYCVENKIEILIYDTIRTMEQQKQNVANGASQTLRSYHLVGQALDFVPVDSKGNTLWNGYGAPAVQKAVKYAKSIGFEWGGDWSKFVDRPHLQYNYKGYGTDTFGKITIAKDELTMSQYKELLAKIERLEKELATKVSANTPILNETGKAAARESIRHGVEQKLFTSDHAGVNKYSDRELVSYALTYFNRKIK